MATNHAKEILKSVHNSSVVILQYLAKASNGRHHSYFENWCLELGTGSPEDMLLTNFGVNHCKSIIGFVLANIRLGNVSKWVCRNRKQLHFQTS